MPECFVIMPLTTSPELANRYGGDADHFAHVLDHLFVPAIEQAGFEPKKPIAEGADLIHAEIVRNLETADLVLCDISALNANVFFEFGIRTALDRPICLVRDEHTKLPFDVGGINCHEYKSSLAPWDLKQQVERLAEHVKVTAERAGRHNALWRHFGLTHRGTDAINAAPGDEQSAALRLILAEIQQIRRDAWPPATSWASNMDEIYARVSGLMDRLDIQWHGAHDLGGGRLEIDLAEPRPSEAVLVEARAQGKALGLDLTFL
jgi:hypothetical protein